MKIFYFMGRNPKTKGGVSWKIWKINRIGRTVITLWGRARLQDRKVVPGGDLASKVFRFSSIEAAREFETSRVRSKLKKGYQRRTRRRT